MKYLPPLLAMFVLAGASFLAVVIGEKLGIKFLVVAGMVLCPIAIVIGGTLVIYAVFQTLRGKRP